MARIRTIKPEFFRHGALFDAERETGLPLRVAFAGLWTACDREGRFRWLPRQLKLDCLPFDELDFSVVLDALHYYGFVHRYSLEGSDFGCIPSWHTHQAINTRESQSRIPAPADGIMAPPPPSRHIPISAKQHVHARDMGVCQQCGSGNNLQFDHIVPFSKGGTHDIKNLQLLCRDCNLSKSDKDLYEDTGRHVHARAEQYSARVEGKGREGKGTETDDADARAAVVSWRQSEAFAIAQEVAEISGQAGEFKESGWGGSTYRVQQWLADGWQREHIISSVKEQTGRRKGKAPPNTIQFFEKGIAEHIARQSRPLPVGEIPRGAYEVSPKSGLAAIDRVFDRAAEVQSGNSQIANEDAVLSLPARSVSGT